LLYIFPGRRYDTRMTADTSQSKPVMTTLVLLGVLLLAVGGAWLMVRFYSGPSRVGAAILEDMRKQGLPKLWPTKRYKAQLQRKDLAGHLESRISVMREFSDGAFDGNDFVQAFSGPPRDVGNVEVTWTVSDDMNSGSYTAVYRTHNFWVKIDLDKGRVSFEGLGMKPVSGDAPANYIPEGLEDLVIRQVARGGKKASFQMIPDWSSYQSKAIVFVRMVLTPVSRQKVLCRMEGDGGKDDMIYYLNADGEVERIEYDGAVMTTMPKGKATPPEALPQPEESPEATGTSESL
jgi:hypothetical protein